MTGRRWRGAEPPWGQQAVVTNPSIVLGTKRKALATPVIRRAHLWMPPFSVATPAAPSIIFQSRPRQHIRFISRHGQYWGAPVSPQQPAWVIQPRRIKVNAVRVPPRRSDYWAPVAAQEQPFNWVTQVKRSKVATRWKRSNYWAPIAAQDQPPYQQHRIPVPNYVALFRKTRAGFIAPPQVAVNPTFIFGQGQHRNQQPPYFKRGRYRYDQFPASVTPPNIVFFPGQRRVRPPYVKRGRTFFPVPPQADPSTNQPYFPGQRTVRRPFVYAFRGRYRFANFPATVTPSGPNIVFIQGQRRTRPPYFKRGRVIAPVPPQANPNTNQPYFLFPSGQRTFRRPWIYAFRGRYRYDQFPPTVTPSGPAIVLGPGQRRTRPPYVKRGRHIAPVPPQANPASNQPTFVYPYRQARLIRAYARRGRQIQPPLESGSWLPQRVFRRLFEVPPTRRGKQVAPPPPPNGNWLPQRVFRRLFEVPPTRRGKQTAPVPPQVILIAPPFVNWFVRKLGVIYKAYQRRGRPIQPGWGQAVAPPPVITPGHAARFTASDHLVTDYFASDIEVEDYDA